MNYWAMWLMVVILLTILEFATVNLVSVWFIASGILSLILSLFVDNLAWQFGVFVVLGILLMVFPRNSATIAMTQPKSFIRLSFCKRFQSLLSYFGF